jgi:hypothetical protein
MSDIMSILQNSYASTPQSLIAPGSKFANVDPATWQGSWTGKDAQNQPVTISITKVSGYRANVVMSSSSGEQFQRAFITTNNTFRIGDSQFALTGTGQATVTHQYRRNDRHPNQFDGGPDLEELIRRPVPPEAEAHRAPLRRDGIDVRRLDPAAWRRSGQCSVLG